MRRAWTWLLLASLHATLSTAGNPPPDPAGGTGGQPLSGTLIVTVVEAGTSNPIQGAFVMAGNGENDPFGGNISFTNVSGQVIFSMDPSLTQPIHVTAGDVGHAYTTIINNGAAEVVLPLSPLGTPPSALIGDEFTGIEVNNGTFCFGDGNIDVGIVLPALTVEEVLNGGALAAISSTSDVLSTPVGDVLIPSNVSVPTQCELLQTFSKPLYSLRLPTGRRTLHGLTARAPLDALLNSTEIVDLVQVADFRELDVLRDQSIVADSTVFDLDANLPVTPNLTIQVTNALTNTTVIAGALGRLTSIDGEEEVIATGLDGFDPDLSGPAATLTVETRAAGGELSDLIPAAVVSQLADGVVGGTASGATTALVRSGFTPPASLSFGSFYEIVQVMAVDGSTFSWSPVLSTTSPGPPDLNLSRLVYRNPVENPDEPGTFLLGAQSYWTLYSRGGEQSLTLPSLPPSAPVAIPDPSQTADQDRLDFELSVELLADDPDGFDFTSFALADAADFATHVSTNEAALPCDSDAPIENLRLGRGVNPGEVVLTWNPAVDICRSGYEIFVGNDPRPLALPGSFPDDPPFARVTDEDTDSSSADESFTHVAPDDDLVLYLVTDRGSSGNPGPAGHYP